MVAGRKYQFAAEFCGQAREKVMLLNENDVMINISAVINSRRIHGPSLSASMIILDFEDSRTGNGYDYGARRNIYTDDVSKEYATNCSTNLFITNDLSAYKSFQNKFRMKHIIKYIDQPRLHTLTKY